MKEPTSDYPEELLDVFKAAALSVTKLYKTSTAAQTKARVDGYQDCLDDLLALLDKGVPDLRALRRWAVERLDGRESIVPTVESEDEVEKTDARPSVEPRRFGSCSDGSEAPETQASAANDTAMLTDTTSSPPSTPRLAAASAASAAAVNTPSPRRRASRTATPEMTPKACALSSTPLPQYQEPVEVSVPSQDTFTFRSSMSYPSESYLELANLALSDMQPSGTGSEQQQQQQQQQLPQRTSEHASSSASASASPCNPSPSSLSGAKACRMRHPASRHGSRSASRHGRGSVAGQKRKLNFEEIFDLASLGYGKDVFGRGGNSKRSRQA